MAREEFDLSDYEDENRVLAKRVLQKRVDNHKRVGRLENQGTSLDVSLARTEFLIRQLVQAGLLSEEQMLNMQLEWEENMAGQLAMIEDQVALRQEAVRKEMEQRAFEMQKQAMIATPPEGLLLPGGRVHLPKSEEKKYE